MPDLNAAPTIVVPTAVIAERRATLERLRAGQQHLRAEIRARFPEEADLIVRWHEGLRRLILVLGGPRCGTSALRSLLARHGLVAALPGEHRPYLTLLGHNFPDHGGEGECDDTGILPDCERHELLDMIFVSAQAGAPLDHPNPREIERFALEWALRLPLQWPELDLDPARVVDAITAVTGRHVASGHSCATSAFDCLLLRALTQLDGGINPACYDIDPTFLNHFPGYVLKPTRPSSSVIVEITPFVLLRPRRIKGIDCGVEALVLKCSSDPYRLKTLRALFAEWDTIVIQLTRNPLASINGLLDGWHHHGFWQHDLGFIRSVPSTRRWWSFDLIDKWHQMVAGPTLDIAAAQWLDPNSRISAAAVNPEANETWHRVAFERFIEGHHARSSMVKELVAAARLPVDAAIHDATFVPTVVNRTIDPRVGRWRERANELLPLLNRMELSTLAHQLGYPMDSVGCWS
jgi:hypothetical protein